jgi:hypothetical protein
MVRGLREHPVQVASLPQKLLKFIKEIALEMFAAMTGTLLGGLAALIFLVVVWVLFWLVFLGLDGLTGSHDSGSSSGHAHAHLVEDKGGHSDHIDSTNDESRRSDRRGDVRPSRPVPIERPAPHMIK